MSCHSVELLVDNYQSIVAVGGVTIENGREHLQAGASAVGVGISLFGEQEVSTGDWNSVEKNVEQFIRRCTVT